MNFKKIRPILAISLCIQSITFFILALINLEKKKSLAATFAVIGAAGGVAGGVLLSQEIKERTAGFDEDDFFDDFDADLDDLDIGEDDIICSFEDEEPAAEEQTPAE